MKSTDSKDARYTSRLSRMRMIGHLMLVRRILETEASESSDVRYSRPRVIDLKVETPQTVDVLAWEAVAS